MADYTDAPFPGDYRPGQVDASPGFLSTFDSMPHFSPANSDHSFPIPAFDPSRPGATTGAAGTPTHPMGELPLGHHGPGSAHGPVSGGGHEHQHSGHSHSFSTASLPSLASSSTSFSIGSQGDHPPGSMYMPGFNSADYAHAHPSILHHDGKGGLALNTNLGPHPGVSLPPGVGLGIGVGMPPTPLSGTLPPALLGRSPIAPPGAVMPGHAMPGGMGKMGHDRNRSMSRPTPYHVSSRSNSLSLKSEGDEELLSIYSGTGYQTSWSNTGNLIAGDMGQMSLEHRRSNSTPFEIPGAITQAHRPRARSFSLGKSSNSLDFLESDLELAGQAADREGQVRSDLASKAEQVRALSPCQHGKARAVWAKRWLKLSYTPVNGFTVPRQGLYHSYTMSCNDFGLRPINSASFGKVVRSTFLGIRTRRLGVRGNSKYHYVSLRPAISTEAHRLNQYGDSSGQLHIAPQDGDFSLDDHSGGDQEILTDEDTDEEEDDDLGDLSEGMSYSSDMRGFRGHGPPGALRSRSTSAEAVVLRSARPAYSRIGAPTLSGASSGTSTAIRMDSPNGGDRALPPFPTPPVGSDPAVVHFWTLFCQTQELLARCTAELQFDRYETNYRSFWDTLSAESLALCSQQPLASLIVDSTAMAFDHLILSLVDKILTPITPTAHAALGMLAVNFEMMNVETLRTVSTEVAAPIVEMSIHVGQLLSRFLDLHQITTAIVPILANPDQLAAMRTSWRMLDMAFIVRQCVMACECSDAILEQALAKFDAWLSNLRSDPSAHAVEQLAACVDDTLARAEAAPGVSSPRQLMPRALFLTSQVMRLLTLRSDPSFGWFQLIKTWVDDYVAIACARRAVFARGDDIDQAQREQGPQQQSQQQQPSGQQQQQQSQPSTQQQTPSSAASGTSAFSSFSAPGGGPQNTTSGHHGTPNLAIDTASAGYQVVPPLDGNAITPRPAFTSSGAATSATGPGVGGMAGQPSANSVASTLAMGHTSAPAVVTATGGFL